MIARQADLLRQAAQTGAPEELYLHHREAIRVHRQAIGVLQRALVTPFDSEDIAELSGGVVRTLNCLRQVAESPAHRELLMLSRDWVSGLAEAIPQLPAAHPIDRRLSQFLRLARDYRLAERKAFSVLNEADALEVVRQQAIRERYQALGASLRALTFQARHVRYRNG